MNQQFDLGFLGGGQLARMSIMAAQRLDFHCLSLDPGKVTPSSLVAPSLQGELTDPEKVAHLIHQCKYITLENEFIPAQVIRQALIIADRDPSCIIPGLGTLATIQDKLLQRQAYQSFGAPTPLAVPIEEAIESIGFPMVLKARFGGYDGKGTRYAKTAEEFESHRPLFEQGGWMAEQFVPFKRELAVMVYRSQTHTGCFPTMETVQVNHVCDLVFPANTDASEVGISAVEAVQGFGLFGVELFELENGEFLINEIAPRPHNTGHYTLDWGGISQFEQHVRLATHLTPAAPEGQETCMANVLGIEDAGSFDYARSELLKNHAQANLHWYGKAEARPGRKMGHINTTGPNCRENAIAARQTFLDAWKTGSKA
ncbi:MAG: ATP-grasp domain-containing protein [Fimbriimonadaceae bacterium]|nr:MAG: ATP-grasp domain-containing protein [Fimbriimonadaceae bacterium]